MMEVMPAMSDRLEKETRRELPRQVREKQRAADLAELPADARTV
jgi:hypothetical protein